METWNVNYIFNRVNHSDILQVGLIPKDSRALHLEFFTVPPLS